MEKSREKTKNIQVIRWKDTLQKEVDKQKRARGIGTMSQGNGIGLLPEFLTRKFYQLWLLFSLQCCEQLTLRTNENHEERLSVCAEFHILIKSIGSLLEVKTE